MTIETKLEFKKYLRLMFIITYRRPATTFISIVGIILLVLSIRNFLGTETMEQPPYTQLFIGVVVLLIPYFIYRSSKKNFSSNSRLTERMIYEFTEDTIRIKGESFDSVMDWNKVHKVVEMKDWVLIYQNKLVFNLIPKESFGDKLEDFRAIVKSQEGLKAKLKR